MEISTPLGVLRAKVSGFSNEGWPGLDVTLDNAPIALIEYSEGGEGARVPVVQTWAYTEGNDEPTRVVNKINLGVEDFEPTACAHAEPYDGEDRNLTTYYGRGEKICMNPECPRYLSVFTPKSPLAPKCIEVSNVLADAGNQHGWNDRTKLDVLVSFIEQAGLADAFAAHVARIAADEREATRS